MSGVNRSGDISFYEELGVANNASAEEIRDAFRALARLMHPDQQTDPQLKEIAERQMRKLNRIYAALSDPERRRRYDELLEDEYPHIVMNARQGPDLQRIAGRFVWGAVIAMGASVLLWLWWDNNNLGAQSQSREPDPRTVAAVSRSSGTTGAANSAAEVIKLRADLRAVSAQRDAAMREIVRLRGPVAAADAGSQPSAISDLPVTPPLPTMTELPAARPTVAPVRPPSVIEASSPPPVRAQGPDRPANSTFTGFWFYVKPAQGQQNKNQTLYPPEFIEATITEENGTLRGKYRSRFQIVDRAISPDVNFSFSGSTRSPAPYTWTGPGGAKGELTLRLTAENQLRVDWTASELGSQQGLSSGTAVLKRRLD